MNMITDTLNRLGIDRRTLATLLNLTPLKADQVRRWENGLDAIPERINKRLAGIPETIVYKGSKEGTFSFIDLFAGIGGVRLPFQNYGGKCVFTAEWDKHSQITYAANFGEVPEKNGDITAFEAKEIPEHDVLLAGFPCQSFSQAGKRGGFYDTRGTMFFEIQRIIAHQQPRAFLLENVKQLKGHDGGRTLATILSILRGGDVHPIPDDVPMSDEARAALSERLNYNVDVAVLRARDFGVPQTRERIYIVGFHRDKVPAAQREKLVEEMFKRIRGRDYPKSELKSALETDLEKTRAYTISDRLWAGHQRRKASHKANGNGFGYSLFTDDSEYCNTISARYYKDGSEILIDQPGLNPRKLTPREAANIQGFPTNFYINAVSDTQLYRQFGNSVAVPVIDAIAREMLPILGIDIQGCKNTERKQNE